MAKESFEEWKEEGKREERFKRLIKDVDELRVNYTTCRGERIARDESDINWRERFEAALIKLGDVVEKLPNQFIAVAKEREEQAGTIYTKINDVATEQNRATADMNTRVVLLEKAADVIESNTKLVGELKMKIEVMHVKVMLYAAATGFLGGLVVLALKWLYGSRVKGSL